MNRPAIDLTVALFACDQGALLHASVVSLERAVAHALRQGLRVQRLLVMHDSDARTERWASEFIHAPWAVVRAPHGGLGHARNAAVAAAQGAYVTFMDGPDLCSETFPADALDHARRATYDAVWHPEVAIRFGNHYFAVDQREIVFHPDPPADGFDYAGLLMANPYSSLVLAPRRILDAVPFPLEDVRRGWTDVDGWWTCNVVGAGFHHRTVPGTAHYQRVCAAESAAGRIGPSPLSRAPLPPLLDVDSEPKNALPARVG